jgi:hypothetical protein
MRKTMYVAAILGAFALTSAGWAAAEAPAKTATAAPPPAAAHQHGPPPATKDAPAKGGMGRGGMGMMGGGMGMGGMGMMGGGMCPMMGGAETQLTVKNVDKGVTLTFTSSDPAKVARLQKMAEAMRLMHEATSP